MVESIHFMFPHQILWQHTTYCLPRDLREGGREGGKYKYKKHLGCRDDTMPKTDCRYKKAL